MLNVSKGAWLFSVLGLLLFGCRMPTPMEYSIDKAYVEHGRIDLGHRVLTAPLALEGMWEFHWDTLATPEVLAHIPAPHHYAPVPGSWELFEPRAFSKTGYGTYRLVIVNPPPDLHLFLLHARCAYSLYVNDRLAASNGLVGESAKSAYAEYRPELITLGSYKDSVELVIQVSNFTHRAGGIANQVVIGSEAVLSEIRTNSMILDALMVGAFLLFGVYHLILFALHRDTSSLCFGSFCFFMALRTMTMGEILIKNMVPNLGAETLLRLEYSALFGFSLFIIYERQLFPKIVNRVGVLSVVSFNVVLLVMTWLLPAPLFTHTVIFWQLSCLLIILFGSYDCVVAVRRRVPDAKVFSLGVVVIVMSGMNDILRVSGIVHTFETVPLAISIILIFQSMILSRHFLRAVTSVRTLSSELEQKTKRERELRRLQLCLQGMLDSVDVALAASLEDGHVLFCNVRFRQEYEVVGDLQASNIQEYLHTNVGAGPWLGTRGESITQSEMDMDGEIVQIYLALFPNKSYDVQSARDVVRQWEGLPVQPVTPLLTASQDALSEQVPVAQDPEQAKRALGVELLNASLQFWVSTTGKSKFDLARESELWRVDVNPDGWERARTLDRYLDEATVPEHPRWRNVVKAAEFVLSYSAEKRPGWDDLHARLLAFRKVV